MKKFFALFLLCTCSFINPISANSKPQIQTINCHPNLQPYLLKMLQVPEVRTLIASIQKEGAFTLEINHNPLSQKFGAFWDVDQRTICINLSAHQTEGQVIGSILFEMHNALANSKINHIDNQAASRQIDRDQYIEAMEYMEYENSLSAAAVATKGIELGIFPTDARLPTYKDFAEHFHYQKIGGHSAWFGKNYDELIR